MGVGRRCNRDGGDVGNLEGFVEGDQCPRDLEQLGSAAGFFRVATDDSPHFETRVTQGAHVSEAAETGTEHDYAG